MKVSLPGFGPGFWEEVGYEQLFDVFTQERQVGRIRSLQHP